MKFTVVLHTDDGTHYGVIVPDLPECFSGGTGIDDALSNVLEAIALHKGSMRADGEVIPPRQPIEVHQSNPDYAGGCGPWWIPR